MCKNPQQPAIAIERVQQGNKNPLVLQYAAKVDEQSQQKFKVSLLLTSEKDESTALMHCMHLCTVTRH
jgi:hypothetical protein